MEMLSLDPDSANAGRGTAMSSAPIRPNITDGRDGSRSTHRVSEATNVLYFKYDAGIIFSCWDLFMGWFIPIESSYIPLKRHSLHFDQAEFAGGSGNLVAVLSKNGCAATYGGTAQPRNR